MPGCSTEQYSESVKCPSCRQATARGPSHNQHLAFQYKHPDSNLCLLQNQYAPVLTRSALRPYPLQLLSPQRSVHCHDADPPRRFPGATGLASWFSPWLPLYPVLSRDLFHDRDPVTHLALEVVTLGRLAVRDYKTWAAVLLRKIILEQQESRATGEIPGKYPCCAIYRLSVT